MLRKCEIVSDCLPLGVIEWTVVASSFEDWRVEDNLYRDQDSLRRNIEKLEGRKKKTGDPPCPEETTQAKHAARGIFGRSSAGEIVESSGEDKREVEVILSTSVQKQLVQSFAM